MAIKTARIRLKGTSPLLMNRFPLVPIEAIEKKTPEEQAETRAYRGPDGVLFIPGVNIQRALISAATYSKGKNRASLQKPAAACLMIREERVSLGVKEYAIDSRRTVLKATNGAVVRHRPRLDEWAVTFTLEYDDTLLNEKDCRRITDDMCLRVGLLDFRPEKKGPFGRSMVTEWS